MLRHLRFDLVDLLERAGAVVGPRGHGTLKERRPGAGVVPGQGFGALQLAQHVELALANEVVAPLALDHLLEHLPGVAALGRVGRRVRVAPGGARVADELDDLGEQAATFTLGIGHVA